MRRGPIPGGITAAILLLCSCTPSEADAKAPVERHLGDLQSELRSSQGSALVADPQSLAISIKHPDWTSVVVIRASAVDGALVAKLRLTAHVDTGGGLWAQSETVTRCLRVGGARAADVTVTSSGVPCPAG